MPGGGSFGDLHNHLHSTTQLARIEGIQGSGGSGAIGGNLGRKSIAGRVKGLQNYLQPPNSPALQESEDLEQVEELRPGLPSLAEMK